MNKRGIFLLTLLWRSWFYLFFSLLLVAIAPVLLVVTAKESWYPSFFKVARFWAKTLLTGMGFVVHKEGHQVLEKDKNYVFVANHTSVIDIMLMLAVVENPFVFVGKRELAKIPVFGFFYKRTCILVDRSNMASKTQVLREAQRRLDTNVSICIFPEGLVPEDESVVLAKFKRGAFKLAIQFQVPVVPMSFYDCKRRFSFTFFSGGPGVLRVKTHPFIETSGFKDHQVDSLKDATYDLLYQDLQADQSADEDFSRQPKEFL